GTMRLGEEEIEIKEGTLAHRIYGERIIRERHRHRYEVNPRYREKIEEHGLIFSAESKGRAEIAELPSHPFFFATQFHPEFKSRPERPSPPFVAFVESMMRRRGLK
ncbi:MAG: CTP synthetase, partial [Archaeoglobi archaeon]|nr:CTP synthetase [Candidatus Mnemosynella bozhongmuii]